MELSELIKFGGNFYTVCDKTGIVYRISDTKTIPWVLLVTGDGNQEAGIHLNIMNIAVDGNDVYT